MRILLIEDEPDLRSGLHRSLRDEGYAVDEAEDGEVALYKAVNTEYDAIILATAGLLRLGLAERIRARISTTASLPAGGQGAVGG